MNEKKQEIDIKILEESEDIKKCLNEMYVDVQDSLPSEITNSIYYPKLKHLLFSEINSYCKEKVDLKNDLHTFRNLVGEKLSEQQIREYLDSLKERYNFQINDIGLDYHIEATRLDYGVPVFVIIKRDIIYMKKFVFRFKKDVQQGVDPLTDAGMLKSKIAEKLTKDGD